MNVKEFAQAIRATSAKIERLKRVGLPKIVGAEAQRHFQDNFRKSGFVNRGLHPWQKSKRQLNGGKDAGRGTLLGENRNLMNSVKYDAGDGRVKIYNKVPYASIHNFGGTLHPTVTPKMRRFAWAKYFEATGAPPKGVSRKIAAPTARKGRLKKASSIYTASNLSVNREAQMWRGLALTKKTKLNIKMPRRHFLGRSKELDDKIHIITEEQLTKILEPWMKS